MENKLDYLGQISRLKKEYNIAFEIYSEEEAVAFLTNNNYYAKIRSYLGSFSRYQEDYRKNHCINVDFAHLVAISKLDMYLRKAVISLSLDIEHSMKVYFVRKITTDSEVDGYDIVNEFQGYRDIDFFGTLITRCKSSDYTKKAAFRFRKKYLELN